MSISACILSEALRPFHSSGLDSVNIWEPTGHSIHITDVTVSTFRTDKNENNDMAQKGKDEYPSRNGNTYYEK